MNAQAAGRRKVLVVEDDPLVRGMFCRMIEMIGFEALRAENGHEALELFKIHTLDIDIVFVDFMMPGRNGEEVMRDIRGIQQNARVVLASGYHELQFSLDDAQPGGFDAFLPKPFRMEQLRNVIQNVLPYSE
jgi:CheY-like chemotaxis protein